MKICFALGIVEGRKEEEMGGKKILSTQTPVSGENVHTLKEQRRNKDVLKMRKAKGFVTFYFKVIAKRNS